MLAQNFKTPADLKISDAEFDALLKVLGMLERGEIASEGTTETLNMGVWLRKSSCGTVGCIAGWARYVSKSADVFSFINGFGATPKHLLPLFSPFRVENPQEHNRRLREIVPAQAAIALRSFLTSGDPRWEEAVAGCRSVTTDLRDPARR